MKPVAIGRRAAAGRGRTPPGARRSFAAAYAGACASCAAAILPGDSIFYATGAEAPSGVDCCGDRDDADLTLTARAEPLHLDEDTVTLAQVLPRNRTAADLCPRCYMIPASNGVCGCA